MPMPPSNPDHNFYGPSSRRPNVDEGEPGVAEEEVSAKSAGAISFAHYIVKWVSLFIVLFSHDSDSCFGSLELHNSLFAHTHAQSLP